MLKPVYDFNKVRNKFKYDANLEIKMYQEEVKEFFDAKSLAERVDAIVDCEYVRYGTLMKMAYNGLNAAELPYPTQEGLMIEILIDEIGSIELFQVIMDKARKIVADANAVKGKKLIDGKVSKEGYSVDATKQISDMIIKESEKKAKEEKK